MIEFLENIECVAPLQNVFRVRVKKSAPKEVSFLTVEQMPVLINSSDVNPYTGFRHRVILTFLYDSGCKVQELSDIIIADVLLSSVATVRLYGKGNKYRTVVLSDETVKLVGNYLSKCRLYAFGTDLLVSISSISEIFSDMKKFLR